MEKMLDKKSRDFAKNMRDTMVYDKSKNEVQIGTNLYVDGYIKTAGNKSFISCSALPLEGNYYTFDTEKFNGTTVVTFQGTMTDKILSINTGSTFIIVDKYFEDNSLLDALSAVPTSNINHADIKISAQFGNGIIIINLSSVVLIYASHEI